MAFFIDSETCVLGPKNPVTEEVDILEGRTKFDMRNLHSFALLDPSIKVLPNKEVKVVKKRQ